MNWLKRFLGLYDREQKAKTEEVAAYVHEKKNTFTRDMLKLQAQAKRVHKMTSQAHEESIKLNKTVDDVTKRMAIATGGLK